MNQNAPIKSDRCAWCNYPGATHEGGYTSTDGRFTESGSFCSQEHFDLWLRWRTAFVRTMFYGGIPQVKEELGKEVKA